MAPLSAHSLEVGFEGLLGVDLSDNINENDRGEELSGTLVRGSFSIFGNQNSSRVRGGFLGEFNTDRQFDDEDTDTDVETFTNFLGALNVFITPRSLSWFIGDALGTVLAENETQSLDERDGSRRNVFVTGPSFTYDLGSRRTFDTRLLYIQQSDDTPDELANLFNLTAGYRSEFSGGNALGFRLRDVYTDNPDESLLTDLNRLTAFAFWERSRGLLDTRVELGGTQYNADGDTVSGAYFRLDATRSLSPQSGLNFSLVYDLADQTLDAIETLADGGTAIADDVDGVARNTTVSIGYKAVTGGNNFSVDVGALNSDFISINDSSGFTSVNADLEDLRRYFASVAWNRALSARIFAGVSGSYIREEFLNVADESDSLVGSATLGYGLSRSWQFQLGYSFELRDGIETSNEGNSVVATAFDSIENRVTLALRWEPPTRANKDFAIDLKSYLQ